MWVACFMTKKPTGIATLDAPAVSPHVYRQDVNQSLEYPIMTRLLSIAVAFLILSGGAMAAEPARIGEIMIEQAWARATPGKAPNGAAYFTLRAEGETADRLVAVASPVAQRTELHTHLMEDGVMKMRAIKAVEVTPGSPTVFQPGGHHVMLMGLKAPLVEGERFPLTLTFERAGSIEIQVEIEKIGAMAPMKGHGGHDSHGHGSHGHGQGS